MFSSPCCCIVPHSEGVAMNPNPIYRCKTIDLSDTFFTVNNIYPNTCSIFFSTQLWASSTSLIFTAVFEFYLHRATAFIVS